VRSSWVKVIVATAVVVGLAPTVRAEAPTPVPQRPLVVTGHVQQPWQYVRQGHSLRDALLLARYDRLAAQGIDAGLLTRALEDTGPTAATGFSSVRPPVAFLTDGGRLRGRHALLEQRYTPGKDGDVVQVVARDAVSGRPLWSRTDRLSPGTSQAAFAARVGSGGVLLLRDRFEKQDGTLRSTVIALSGDGRVSWTRALPPEQVFGDGTTQNPVQTLGLAYAFDFSFNTITVDLDLRPGAPDLLVVTQHMSVGQDALGRQTVSGSVKYQAVSQVNGAVRALAGSASSSDGLVLGGPVGDEDGDGYVDLATVDGGSHHRATVRRARDGRVVWERTDLVTHGAGWLDAVGHLSGARAGGRPVEDLTLSTWADPGVAGVDVFLPVTSQEVQDPTASAHGTVTLLAGGTGRTLWTKSGDWSVEVLRAGVPAVAVATDLSSRTSTSVTAALRLEAFTLSGAARWTRSWSLSAPQDPSGQDSSFSGVSGFALDDLDGDGGVEAVADLVIFRGDSERESLHLVQARDGSELTDRISGFLWAGVTRRGHDRFRVSTARAGITVRVLRGRDSAQLFSRLVPGSRDLTSADVWGNPDFRDTCSDLLVMGGSAGRTFVAVLAPDGTARWYVNRAGTDARAAGAHAVRPSARPRC
jgi:hypothetical protein